MKAYAILIAIALSTGPLQAKEYHVATTGLDSDNGSQTNPFQTISRAAERAQPGDDIVVHEGIYRERINPPRGGTSDHRRITYRAAEGEEVAIRGSEVVTGWQRVEGDVWKVVLPKAFFGGFNPFSDLISGSWFHRKGRDHHTGAVYVNGQPLAEAAQKDEVLDRDWGKKQASDYLFNIEWLRPAGAGQEKVSATATLEKHGTKNAPTDAGGECLGFIKDGDWATYSVDFGESTEHMEFRVASAAMGGHIEIRENSKAGRTLGIVTVSGTGGWQAWRTIKAPIKPVSGKKTLHLRFKAKVLPTEGTGLWFAEVDEQNTTLWARVTDADPNQALTEVHARQAVFYPEQTGINYITLKGFTLEHAATPWAPPNAEQIGLVGTHWSKGWVIENNTIRHSTCVGITLGKYGDAFDNIADTADGYNGTIRRALEEGGWSKETVGSHIVRNNTIHDCGAAGICGSMGGAFSEITENHIYNIHNNKPFSGFEQAAIKIHASIDMLIANNRIHDSSRGIWLDWMAQGTRVSGNLCYRNKKHDLFMEVNHGPFTVDNNLFLSPVSLTDWSQGGAYAHNLFSGKIDRRPQGRQTPYHKAHSTELAGLSNITGGDVRFLNNILAGDGLDGYNEAPPPMLVDGNAYLGKAQPFKDEASPLVEAGFDPDIRIVEEQDAVCLEIALPGTMAGRKTSPVTGERLGTTRTAGAAYENPDGSPLVVDTDYFRGKRTAAPTAGPFQSPGTGPLRLTVWPKPGLEKKPRRPL